MHEDDDSLRLKATAWGYDQSSHFDVVDGSKFIGGMVVYELLSIYQSRFKIHLRWEDELKG